MGLRHNLSWNLVSAYIDSTQKCKMICGRMKQFPTEKGGITICGSFLTVYIKVMPIQIVDGGARWLVHEQDHAVVVDKYLGTTKINK